MIKQYRIRNYSTYLHQLSDQQPYLLSEFE